MNSFGRTAAWFAALACLSLSSLAFAHGGHDDDGDDDHDHAEAPANSDLTTHPPAATSVTSQHSQSSPAQRATAGATTAVTSARPAPADSNTSAFEVVAAREHGDIVVYVDDYASNAPVDGLRLQLRIGTQLLQAGASGNGIYRVPGDLVPAHVDGEITVLLQGPAGDLQIRTELPDESAVAAAAPVSPLGGIRIAIALVLIAVVLLLGWRVSRRRAAR